MIHLEKLMSFGSVRQTRASILNMHLKLKFQLEYGLDLDVCIVERL